jgi:hypothetical protein
MTDEQQKRGRGRQRIHESAAARQAAYRARHPEKVKQSRRDSAERKRANKPATVVRSPIHRARSLAVRWVREQRPDVWAGCLAEAAEAIQREANRPEHEGAPVE